MRVYVIREGVYVCTDNHQPFNYSDGDRAEEYLLELITNASDLSIGSAELVAGIRDWSSLYHLNPRRADLLRPFGHLLKGKSVLEIGSGCGAITRYLGECGGKVTAVEGSYRRALITQQRCRDLHDIKIICDNFEDLYLPEKFDIVTLIGVLEYSNFFIHAENPVEAMLQKVRSFLKPGGSVLIAIENKLGLKYLAGAPEDHLEKPYFGIENKYDHSTAITFGKKELTQLLSASGLGRSVFYYPFPDYKLPGVVLTEKGIQSDLSLATGLLSEKWEYFQSRTYTSLFSTSLAMEAFAKNDLLSHFSNSFLVLAGVDDNNNMLLSPSILAYVYDTGRNRPFCKENIFIENDQGEVTVIRKKIYDLPTDPTTTLYQIIDNESYCTGPLLSKTLINLTSRNGWTLDDLGGWAQTYYSVLSEYAVVKETGTFLEGKYLDLIPANIILKEGGKVQVFGREWGIREDLPLYYVFFRGISQSINEILFYNPPVEGTPGSLPDLSLAIVNKIFPFTGEMLQDCLVREKKYFFPAVTQGFRIFDGRNIHIRGSYDLENQVRLQQQELTMKEKELDHTIQRFQELKIVHSSLKTESVALQDELDSTLSRLEATQQEMEKEREVYLQLRKEKEWFINTYDKKHIFGIAKDRLFLFLKNKKGYFLFI